MSVPQHLVLVCAYVCLCACACVCVCSHACVDRRLYQDIFSTLFYETESLAEPLRHHLG